MSQSLTIHQELRKQYVLQQVSNLEIQLNKWITQNISSDETHHSQFDEAYTQSQTSTNIVHFQGFLQYLKSLSENPSQLEFHTLKSLTQSFEYMSQVLQNEVKLLQQKQKLQEYEQHQYKKGHKFSKQSNLILKKWLNTHYSYPYPTKEQISSLAEKCNLTEKQVIFYQIQIQIWFINARGRIGNKFYEEKKFKNIVKSKYLSLRKKIINGQNLEDNEQQE